ncbi:hypothetical protein K443DRAFT_280741 [Laccaria amethystina LaAM-08-1]|uniref:Transmembrane protein n=1 Tax=Laccaria amethystina LaAM-08-1 TaxID=1095629 RepID=A0A0C9Y8F4_9AGAR|nr:hypothetical protein K443DRAFT_280741 [Laccaria amethystina LaAM-08-1]
MSSRLLRILSLALLSLGLSFAAPASLETAEVQHTLVHTKPGEGAIRHTDFIHELRQVTRNAAVTTLYNPFEATIPTTKAQAGKGHHLAPVSQVFRVMTVKGPKATSPPVSPPAQTTTTQVNQALTTPVDQQMTTQEDQHTTATEAPSEPTVPSGGLVLLTSSDDVPAETETPIPEPSATPTPKKPVSHPLEKVAVLGGALGGIALIAFLTFIIMHPCVSRLWRREQPPKRPKKVRTPSWMRVLPVSPVLPEADEKGISGHSADLWGNQRVNQRPPASPDSKYSSSSSRRSSSRSCYDVPVLASGAPYNSVPAPAAPNLAQYKAALAAYNKAPPGAPPRPKRPPTEDGPGALSDAMILACANQLSAKQTDRTLPANTSPLLSPKEFFTMPTSPSEQDAPALLVSSPSHDHTRAHSAPQKLVVRNASVNDRILHDDSVPSGIGRKMLEHRRSRSASGWAYPKRPQGSPRNLRKPKEPHYSAQFENISGDR